MELKFGFRAIRSIEKETGRYLDEMTDADFKSLNMIHILVKCGLPKGTTDDEADDAIDAYLEEHSMDELGDLISSAMENSGLFRQGQKLKEVKQAEASNTQDLPKKE